MALPDRVNIEPCGELPYDQNIEPMATKKTEKKTSAAGGNKVSNARTGKVAVKRPSKPISSTRSPAKAAVKKTASKATASVTAAKRAVTVLTVPIATGKMTVGRVPAPKTPKVPAKAAVKVAKPEPQRAASRMPGEQHPGQTSAAGRQQDRKGSQIERERHQYPGSTIPKAGAGRSNKRPKRKG